MTDFTTLGLSAPFLRTLEEQGFNNPTAIQQATIPTLITGQDVIGLAQTGSGKTAAFVLPMLERLYNHSEPPKPGMPRALVLAPTRELAIQITDAVKSLARHTKLKNCTVFGGAPYRTQTHILKRGVDVLIATPGRLMDHMKRGNVYLDEVEYFVLDEADRMLDMGFVDNVRKISSGIRREHQSVLFSATLNGKIRDLADTLLKEPEHIQVAREATIADNLSHKILFVPRRKKHELLLHMIEKESPGKALIFVRTKREADELADFMDAMGLNVRAIHGDKQQRQRERIIRGFRNGRTDFLVATDVAARGIDVRDISHVFNIDVPIEAESYVHRIGRTARGGMSGKAFTFCSKEEFGLLHAIERLIKMEIDTFEGHPFPLLEVRHAPKARKKKQTKPGDGRKPGRREAATKVKTKKTTSKKPGKKSTKRPTNEKTAKTVKPNKGGRKNASKPNKSRRTTAEGFAPLKRRA